MKESEFINEVSKYYDTRASGSDSIKAAGQWHQIDSINEICLEISKKIGLNSKSRVLEIGCGSGVLGNWIKSKCSTYYGFDISHEMLKSFLNESNTETVNLLRASADKIPFQKDSFDIIILNGVAMYFINDDFLSRVLKEIQEIISKNGLIFIGETSTPSRYYWEFAWFQNLSKFKQNFVKPYIKFRKWIATKNSKIGGKWTNTYSTVSEKFLKDYFKGKGKINISDAAAYTIRKKKSGKNSKGNKRVDFTIKLSE
jgi:ubiquinone/menaquinone biosynthesis C-methylase UbiE